MHVHFIAEHPRQPLVERQQVRIGGQRRGGDDGVRQAQQASTTQFDDAHSPLIAIRRAAGPESPAAARASSAIH